MCDYDARKIRNFFRGKSTKFQFEWDINPEQMAMIQFKNTFMPKAFLYI